MSIAIAALAAIAALPAAASAALPPIHHVFIIVLENESASTTFAAKNPPAPYLATTLKAEGAFLPKYYGTGHESNDNYISMISGQAPNPENQADCMSFSNFATSALAGNGQATGPGCVYPTTVQTVANQLTAAGLTWRDYNDGMGADPTRETGVCAHPNPGIPGSSDPTQTATAKDQYATRHNPFVYFHSIIDDTTLCDTHVVNLDLLPQDLATASSTPNYVFITPNLCDDGHDATCADHSKPGGFAGINAFLKLWEPRIVNSPAYKYDNGLLIINFDEASTSDASSCCGEIAGPGSPSPGITGSGGGDTGAVLLSPCIKPGTVTMTPYNHYTMLRSVEDIFRLSHLGFAGLSGEVSFGSDIFTHPACSPAPKVKITSPPLIASTAFSSPKVTIRWKSTGLPTSFTVQDRVAGGPWKTLARSTTKLMAAFRGRDGVTYQFRVRAQTASGQTSAWATTTTEMLSGVNVAGGVYGGSWMLESVRAAWDGHAEMSATAGSTFTLAYTGGALALVGDVGPNGGAATVTFDGRSHTVSFRSARAHARRVVFKVAARRGRHTLTVDVVSGSVALEGVAINSRTR